MPGAEWDKLPNGSQGFVVPSSGTSLEPLTYGFGTYGSIDQLYDYLIGNAIILANWLNSLNTIASWEDVDE